MGDHENCETVSKPGESDISTEKLWKEIKEWRNHWELRRFFEVLFLGVATSLFDSGTDFNFAWSVPYDCRTANSSILGRFDTSTPNPCGHIYYKNVERLTYTYIAYPGFFLGIEGLQSLVKGCVHKCWGGKVGGIFGKLGHFLLLTLEVSVAVGLLLAAQESDAWEKTSPDLEILYDYALRVMAYSSATIVVGVKCLGVLSHGPETRGLVFKATITETIFEAALQLVLLYGIFLGSGVKSEASVLSAVSSILLLGKVGVQNFRSRHREKLSNASTLGAICGYASVLPIFVLTALFKIGIATSTLVWSNAVNVAQIFLAIGLPMLILAIMRYRKKDLTVSHIGRGILSELLVFHFWPKTDHGRKIGMAMTVFVFLLYVAPVPFVVANPIPEDKWCKGSNNTVYGKWASETGQRLQIASVASLVIGCVASALGLCLLLFEDKWLARILSAFPNLSKENITHDRGTLSHAEGNPKKTRTDTLEIL